MLNLPYSILINMTLFCYKSLSCAQRGESIGRSKRVEHTNVKESLLMTKTLEAWCPDVQVSIIIMNCSTVLHPQFVHLQISFTWNEWLLHSLHADQHTVSSIKDVRLHYLQEILSYNPAQNLPNSNGAHPWVLVNGNEPAIQRGLKASGSTKKVAIRLATRAREQQRSPEALWKEVQSCHQPWTSSPEGPVALPMRNAVLQTRCSSRQSKIAGWQLTGGRVSGATRPLRTASM